MRSGQVNTLIGDMFDSHMQTLVNTVNCVGVMGKGVALEFKRRFPSMFKDYVARCARGEVTLGEPYMYRRILPPWILNFPTKGHWRPASRLSDIHEGMRCLLRNYKGWGVESMAMPALGCGCGRLDWHAVEPILHCYLSQMDIQVELYAPLT